jgi:undecaprenyl-diphosphatase
LFFFINRHLGRDYLDPLLLLLSSELFWGILFGLALIFVHIKRDRQGIKFIWLALVGIGITDLFAYRVLKPLIGRMRPCYQFEALVRLVPQGCGSEFGFPSNHAANAMVIATVAFGIFGYRRGAWVFLLALLVGFSRIYLGVHFPGDVLFGYLVGALFGLGLLWCADISLKIACRATPRQKKCATTHDIH